MYLVTRTEFVSFSLMGFLHNARGGFSGHTRARYPLFTADYHNDFPGNLVRLHPYFIDGTNLLGLYRCFGRPSIVVVR